MEDEASLERALAAAEQRAAEAMKLANAVVSELKKVQAAARAGQLPALGSSLDTAASLAAQLSEATTVHRSGWSFDGQAHMESGAFAKEILALAQDRHVKAFEQDDVINCFPSLVRVIPSATAVSIDKKRFAKVRPSVLVDELERLQGLPPRLKVGAFLEALAKAYDIQIARDSKSDEATVKVADLYGLFTLLPGQRGEYSKQEFARDLFLLDQSNETTTKAGRTLRWQASTLTKSSSGVMTTVSKDGQLKTYAGVSFA